MARPTPTKTCPRCGKSCPEDQFRSDNGTRMLKLCFPCRNSSRISHRKRRVKLENEAKRREEETLNRLKKRHPEPAPASASAPAPALATPTPARPVIPAPTPVPPSAAGRITSQNPSPGRHLADFLSEVKGNSRETLTPAPTVSNDVSCIHLSLFDLPNVDKEGISPEKKTPELPLHFQAKKRRLEATALSALRANEKNSHQHLLSLFLSSPTKMEGDIQAANLNTSKPAIGEKSSARRTVKEEIFQRVASAAAADDDDDREATAPLGTPAPDVEYDIQVKDHGEEADEEEEEEEEEEEGKEEEKQNPQRHIVCRFYIYTGRA
ncbi:hypothetical protein P175DRAFT_0558152 [Aspergillus ochraceoroseus IBT 24754]|uniref:Uncharacterized protein n=1 Tax=Aspergillus ochraceoroseus IBT 24754 TaxID=1392256 RepID=A0A2T5LUJ1_9EURO|nr:uncharacterized protein P175DRAFT_0558152 [Aspergillus ochraceoroseus IBT 24754]PTU19956.1 hypothetical protein P175DRAFT_0558152 [Aspergillus ochraceoroseus IBT 24754]